ncbi:MAG: oligosaccharide flippase family protein [Pacificimonas sp.]
MSGRDLPPDIPVAASSGDADRAVDTKALAKGGRTNFFGFVLRLMARIPFLVFAGQFYGAEALGRFAYATMVVEVMAVVATLGLRRGIAAELAKEDRPPAHVIGDALLVAIILASCGAAVMIAVPEIVFPASKISGLDRLFPLSALFFVGSEVTLAALAYRHNIKATVNARAIIEPWTITIVAVLLAFIPAWKPDALIIAYAASMVTAFAASVIPCIRMYGLPRRWRPRPARLFVMMKENWPIAGADTVDWAMRRVDILILGQLATPTVLGIYYVAQQFASLAQKLKITFDPILAPVIAHGVKTKDYGNIAQQLRQVGFWILSAQLGIALCIGFVGEASLEVVGDGFGAGAGILFLLLAAEVFYVTGAVSESALVYMARHRNLTASLITLAAQIVMTFGFIQLFDVVFPDVAENRPVQGIGAAMALALAALLSSILKVMLLHHLVPDRVSGMRWVFVPATIATAAVGFASMRFLPDLWQILLGLPVLIMVYGGIVWHFGYKGSDRLIFSSLSKAKERQANDL